MRLFILATAVLLIVACPGNHRAEDESQNAPPKTSTTTMNPQAVPERTGTMNPLTPVSTSMPSQRTPVASPLIEVQLLEYEIRMPDTLKAGVQHFPIENAGKMNHNFAIEGNGVSEKLASDLTRGNTTDLFISLGPGTYTVYCPIDKHRGRGMQRTITIHQ
jgi:uncharacterized cupredoxin-like copper-binding protein